MSPVRGRMVGSAASGSCENYCEVSVKLPLCLIKQAPCHEDIWGSRGIAPPFLTSTLDVSEWSCSRPCRFTPRERGPSTHWIGGWVGPRAGLDALEKKKKILPLPGFTHRKFIFE
jgi:hypothetical protein